MVPISQGIRDLSVEAVRRLAGGEAYRFAVAGVSMEPVLLAGDEIHACRLLPGEHLRLGELLVVALPAAGLVVHRLLWAGRDGVRTRGDGSGVMDPLVSHEDVLGRVCRVVRQGQDVTPGSFRTRLAWCRQFAGAALHRLGRRLL